MQCDFGGGEDVEFYRQGCAGIIRLTRPRALNALNKSMVVALTKALQAWEHDDAVALVLVEGEGRAFCAGGDVVGAYHSGRAGQPDYDFFSAEYRLNGLIGCYPKPYIAYLNGIVMGGGVGISLHGSHRLVTPNTLFAMPETAIGFFPDVGTATILPNLADHFGIYLGLTGARIKWGDCLQLGLATHAIDEDDYLALRQQLCDGQNPDAVLAAIAKNIPHETAIAHRSVIATCFSAPTMEEMIERLRAREADTFAQEVLELLTKRSPTSLKVTLSQMQFCQRRSLQECLVLDNRIAHHMIEAGDFYEGVRALLIDKDNRPLWQPQTLGEVRPEQVVSYFDTVERELVW